MIARTTTPPNARRGLRREQLSDEVAAHLRAGIMSGTLRPGTYIRLDETAAELGVSITPVREALRTLRGEGMVQLEPHRGHVVSAFTRGDIEDIFWLQATLAGQLARSAALRITDEEIDELERLAEVVAAAVYRRDADQVANAEFGFHRAFNRYSGRIKLSWFLLHAARYLPPHIYASDEQHDLVVMDANTFEILERHENLAIYIHQLAVDDHGDFYTATVYPEHKGAARGPEGPSHNRWTRDPVGHNRRTHRPTAVA